MPGRSPRHQRATLHAPSPATARSAGHAHVAREEEFVSHRACSIFVLKGVSCQDRRLTMRRSGSITRPVTLQPLLAAPFVIQIHALAAITAFAVGLVQL